jgi:hypothetical protein
MDPKETAICDSTYGLLCFGVPHVGAGADEFTWARLLQRVARQTQTVKGSLLGVSADFGLLDHVQKEFNEQTHNEKHIEVVCFYETLPDKYAREIVSVR